MGSFVITALCFVLATASLESAQQQMKTEIRPSDVHPLLHDVHPLLHYDSGFRCKVCSGDLDQAILQSMQQESKNHYLRDAVIKKDLDAVKHLLQEGAQVNVASMAKTPLHEAALLGYAEIVRELLSYSDIEVNAESRQWSGIYREYTPLIFAVSRGKLGSDYVIRTRREGCAVAGGIFKGDPSFGSYATYQRFAIQKGSDTDYESVVEQLIEKGALARNRELNEMAIIVAARHGTLKMVQMLITAGVDLNVSIMMEETETTDKRDYKYLQKFENVIKIAIDTHNVELLKILLAAGARAGSPIIERTVYPGEFCFPAVETELQNPLCYLIHKYNALDALQALREEERKKVSEIIEELLVHGVAQIDYNHFCDKLRWIGAGCALKNAEKRLGHATKQLLIAYDYLLPDLARMCEQYF